MFRIDRNLVKVSRIKFKNFDDEEEAPEVDAEDEDDIPDAATSMEMMYNEYMQAARLETEEKMDKLLEDARHQAAQIILDAREEAEEELRRGFRKGFEEGSDEGKRSFDEKTEAKIQEDDKTLKRLLDEMYEERERTYSSLEGEVTNLAIEIVKKIIYPAEDELENVYMSLIKNALRQMPTEGKIVLRVGAKEYERFFASGAAKIELDSGTVVTASVLRDVTLEDGDCIIDTDDVTINAGIESQLQFVKLAFERANQYEPE